MALVKITEKALNGLRASAQRQRKTAWLWDTETKGFGCRATPAGSLRFVFQVWEGGRGGKSRRITLTEIALDKARTEAETKRVDANKGILVSPRQERLQKQRKLLQSKTVSEAISLYLEENKYDGRYWKEIEDRLNKSIIPILKGDRKISEITTEDLRELFRSYNDRPVAKRAVYWILSPLFKWCMSEEYISDNPLYLIDPPPGGKSGQRYLKPDEVKLFWNATSKLEYPWKHFYRLLLLTGQRRNEVARMEWRELDLEQGVWTIPPQRAKNKLEHIVYLSPLALSCLPDKNKARYVLLSGTGKTPVSAFSDAKEAIDALLPSDIPDWNIHDLRRTFDTLSGENGLADDHVIDAALNHTKTGLRKVYNRAQYLKQRRELFDAWGAYVSNLVDPKPAQQPSSNVLSFPAR